jgi:hypothetical protein
VPAGYSRETPKKLVPEFCFHDLIDKTLTRSHVDIGGVLSLVLYLLGVPVLENHPGLRDPGFDGSGDAWR